MRRVFCSFVVCLALGVSATAAEDGKTGRRIRLGGVVAGASYNSGPLWFPYNSLRPWGPWGFYDPFWAGSFMHPGLYNGFAYGPNMGEVKLPSAPKDASVYLDGAYAGSAEKLKSMWLEPGSYNFEIRDAGGRSFSRKIYVLTGKTLRLKTDMLVEGEKR